MNSQYMSLFRPGTSNKQMNKSIFLFPTRYKNDIKITYPTEKLILYRKVLIFKSEFIRSFASK